MKNYLLFAVTICILFFAAASKQTVITGTVTDATDGSPIPGVNVVVKNFKIQTVTDVNGRYSISAPTDKSTLVFSFIGYETYEIKTSGKTKINVSMAPDLKKLEEVEVIGYSTRHKTHNKPSGRHAAPQTQMHVMYDMAYEVVQPPVIANTEEYAAVQENIYHEATKNPLSTFSIDVDAASYSNVRRMLNNGQLPNTDAVRVEEMINYFDYDYQQPKANEPFSINTEVAECPWNKDHQLVHIGLQGKTFPANAIPASNLVFLVDVSGSMDSPEKLPLLKSAFHLLINQLRKKDKIAIVVYAGSAGLVLPSTSGDEKQKIKDALENLQAGGSTAGGAGIQLAYKIAKENFIKGGNNRVVLATDGDFNVGASSNVEMERLIEQKREDGVFLTVLGFGMGNYKDSKMEILADKGNGNYAYIDNITEARKVLVNEFGGTLFTIAKDVKIQVEFNPANVKAYRLIGYENRMLQAEDFNNDKKDAGELGAGHTVTALYEIIPVGTKNYQSGNGTDPLKYQQTEINKEAFVNNELLTVKFRYKEPEGTESKLLVNALPYKDIPLAKTSDNFRFSAAVAAFGMLLRDSEHKGSATFEQVETMAKSSLGADNEGYRAEFLSLVKSAKLLSPPITEHPITID